MASYNPPSEDLPIFDNTVFVSANSNTLTKSEANSLYLRKTIEDTCTALETFSAGISASFINVSGTITSATMQAFSNIITPLITTDEYNVSDSSVDCDFCNNQISGILNIGTNARTGNFNIGTGQTNNQLSIGSTTNTQTNILGGAIALFGDTDVINSLTAQSGILTNSITSLLPSDNITICTETTRTGRITIGGNTTSSTAGIYIGGTNNPISVFGSCNFVNGLVLSAPMVMANSSYITPPTTPPTLPINALAYYYNYPVLSVNNATTGYDFNPSSNTTGGSNYFNAGVYTATVNSIARFGGTTTAGNYTYNVGVSYTTSTGLVTSGASTIVTPVSGSMRGFYFGNIANVDFSNSQTICFTITTDSFVNLFTNMSSLSLTGGGYVTTSTYGCVRRIA